MVDEELESLLGQLMDLAGSISIEVRKERFGGDAATAFIKGKKVIFLDPGVPLRLRVKALAKELAEFEWEGVYLRPNLRELLEAEKES